MRRRYVMATKDLYKRVLWPHLSERLPRGVRKLVGVKTEAIAHELCGNILDDYMEMAFEEMVDTGYYWPLPCLNTGYIYIKDQRDFIEDYVYDIELGGSMYHPVMILDKSITSKCKGYFKVLISDKNIDKIQQKAKSGVRYNENTR